MIERERIEAQIVVFRRMAETVADLAAEHRANGNLDSAKHCAGVSEGLSIGLVTLRCLLEPPAEVEGHPLLRIVS
jgi:hypothetical protein